MKNVLKSTLFLFLFLNICNVYAQSAATSNYLILKGKTYNDIVATYWSPSDGDTTIITISYNKNLTGRIILSEERTPGKHPAKLELQDVNYKVIATINGELEISSSEWEYDYDYFYGTFTGNNKKDKVYIKIDLEYDEWW